MEKVGYEMIVDEIFTRLPAKAIGRFKCLSKMFRKELSTYNFELKFTTKEAALFERKVDCRRRHRRWQLGSRYKQNHYFSIRCPSFLLTYYIAVNGLLLVCIQRSYSELILWKPTMKLYNLISDDYFIHRFGRNSDTGGMYFDEANDLKVLHINCYSNELAARVYSRRRDSWRKLNFFNGSELASTFYSWSPGIYSGNTIYFMISNYWFPPGERNIVAFDVLSGSFSILRYPKRMEVNPCQRHFLTISNKLHVIVVGYAGEIIADLFRYEHDDWIKVFSFNIVHYLERQQRTNITQDNKWLIISIWGDTIEVVLCNESFNYPQHVDSYNGPKGALFFETTVSPID